MSSMNNEEDENYINSNPLYSKNNLLQDANQSSESLSISESDLLSKQHTLNIPNQEKMNISINNNKENQENQVIEKDYEILADYKGNDYLSFKLILIGDVSVGKSSLINRAIKNTFQSGYSPTLGFDYFNYYIKINDKILKLQIWDTGGQEIYQSIVNNFYRNSSFAFMVYAIDNKESFEHIDNWLKEIKYKSSPDIKIFLVGNKCDLTEERKVTSEEGKTYCKNYEFAGFYEVSAKTGERAEEILVNAAKVLLNDFSDYQSVKNNKNDEIIIENDDNISARSRKENDSHSKCC